VDKKIALSMIIEEIKNKGSVRIKVRGGSMSPVIRDNEIVQIRKSALAEKEAKLETRNNKERKESRKGEKIKACCSKPGNIVCYKAGDWFLMHRVKNIDCKTGLITVEGDSRDSVVHKIKKSDIIGIVEEKFRHKIMRFAAGVLKQKKQGKQVKQEKQEK